MVAHIITPEHRLIILCVQTYQFTLITYQNKRGQEWAFSSQLSLTAHGMLVIRIHIKKIVALALSK